jgi:hypothetical protein
MSVDNMEKLRYSQLVPGDKQLIFDMERQTAGCAPFIICAGTSSRPNRPTPDPAFVFDCHSNIRQSPFGWKVLKDPSHPLYAARRQRELDYLKKLGNCPDENTTGTLSLGASGSLYSRKFTAIFFLFI